MAEADGDASGEAAAATKRPNAEASLGLHGGAASSGLPLPPPLSSIPKPATPQLFKALTEENLRLHLQSRRSQRPREQPSGGRRNPAPSYAAAAIPMPPSLIQLRSGQSELGQGRTRPRRRGIISTDYRLDWTGRRISDPFLPRIRDLGLGPDSGRGPRRGGRRESNHSRSPNPIPSSISSISSLLASLRLYFPLFFPCGKDILPDLISCESDYYYLNN